MFHDVRMRGFRRRADVADVQAWLDALPLPRRLEQVTLEHAARRVLAADLVSEVDVPAFARSAMDGWALRGEQTFGAAETDPIALDVVGTSLPGAPFEGTVEAGQAVRIMTGAPVPDGADTVLRAEDGRQEDDTLHVRAAVPVGKNVGHVGEDIRAGDPVLRAGRALRPQDLGVASSVGCAALEVVAEPTVELLVTGDEILEPGAQPDGVHIVDANSPMLRALIARDGGNLTSVRFLPDDEAQLRDALVASDADVLLVTGGSSVGQEDHAPRLLAELGELRYHGVGLRPAAPAGMGTLGKRPIFLLPGNPVSCLCAYDFFAGRVVRRMTGRDPAWPYAAQRGRLARKIASVLGRVDYVRVRLGPDGVEPVMARGASILSSTTEADGFVIVPKDHEGWPEGTEVEVHLYDVLRR
ncbi:MAG: molybdopterin molybdotransferase MoeA [Planctomycetota bacterium]|nr:molybdopterin molybdotransferase MoeA [Planctomycetota bacterium]